MPEFCKFIILSSMLQVKIIIQCFRLGFEPNDFYYRFKEHILVLQRDANPLNNQGVKRLRFSKWSEGCKHLAGEYSNLSFQGLAAANSKALLLLGKSLAEHQKQRRLSGIVCATELQFFQ